MKRVELVGTRKLTKRSLGTAVNESRVFPLNEYDEWLYQNIHAPKRWRTVEPMLRTVEEHVIVHQQRQVYALVKKLLGVKAAAKIAKAWTMKTPKR